MRSHQVRLLPRSSMMSRKALMLMVKAGAQLPEDLLLVHERSDHYSLQAAKEMTLDGRCAPQKGAWEEGLDDVRLTFRRSE